MCRYYKDPLDKRENPYRRFNLKINATPDKIEEAFMRYLTENAHDIVEAELDKNRLLETDERMIIDFFYYMVDKKG